MVLRGRPLGRVGRRRAFSHEAPQNGALRHVWTPIRSATWRATTSTVARAANDAHRAVINPARTASVRGARRATPSASDAETTTATGRLDRRAYGYVASAGRRRGRR